MTKLYILFALIFSGSLAAEHAELILDDKTFTETEPAHFRKMTDPFRSSHHGKLPSRTGLSQLKASGSGQPSKSGFEALVKQLKGPKHLTIVDIRQESHGFIN